MVQIQSFTFNPLEENTYLLFNEQNDCIVIDPGCYFDEEKEEISTFIEKRHLKPVLLLNTHCHLDHVFGNKFIAETFGLILHMHENDKPVLDFAPTSGLMYNIPFDNYKGALVYLKEGEKIFLGDDELEIIFTPGHSPGSVCFYCAKQHFLIGGDVLFQRSIGRSDLPGGNFDTLMHSIKEKLFLLPDQTKVYSGHGPVTTIGEEKMYNPFLRL